MRLNVSRAISLYVSGASLGTIVAVLACPIIVLSLGWPVVFYISGVLGLRWLAIWILKAADGPENCAGVNAQELAHWGGLSGGATDEINSVGCNPAREGCVGDSNRAPVQWLGGYIVILWLPSYLHQTFNVPMERLRTYSIIPWIAAFCVGNISGWIADVLCRRGMSLTVVRRLM